MIAYQKLTFGHLACEKYAIGIFIVKLYVMLGNARCRSLDVYLGRVFRFPSDKSNQLMQNCKERIEFEVTHVPLIKEKM